MPQPFQKYDTRHYRTLDVNAGYEEWAAFYDQSVLEHFDIGLLATLEKVNWANISRAVDLGCGTGRIGTWMRGQGVERVDGLDCTSGMLQRAVEKRTYSALALADLTKTPFLSAAYDLCISFLAVCHIERVEQFYAEARRLVRPGGTVVLLDYHPFFLVRGIPTHFRNRDGESIAIQNFVHFFSDHVEAGTKAGLTLVELKEKIVDEAWVEEKPTFIRYLHQPISFAIVWRVGS